MKLSILIIALLSIVYVTSIKLDEIKFTPIGEEITFAPTKYHRQSRQPNGNTNQIEELYAPTYESDETRYKRQSDEMIMEDNHTYYLSTFYPSVSGVFNELWVDLTLNTSHHVLLSNTYLKYINIDFDLPFYGHLVSQVSITTAGFISIFDTPHPYIHLTQYIAPFSADFNPSQNSESKIYYQIDEDRVIVLWDKVTLNGRPQIGFFTFETIVYRNGTIIFLYKDIPALLNETSTTNYTSLIGVADAFLVELAGVRIIYTYHRVKLGEGLTLEGTVFQLDPVPNCVVADSWESCRNISCYSSFSCGWCSKIERCSDGIDRHRQTWIDEGCSVTDALTCASQPPQMSSGQRVLWVLVVLIVILLVIVALVAFIIVGVVFIIRRNKQKTTTLEKYSTM